MKIEQNRIVGGIRGDLPFVNFGSVKDFSFDVYASHSYSNGESSRSGIREDKLNFALGVDPNTGASLSAPCTPNADSNISAVFAEGCVPVNLFAPSLLNQAIGDFATQAERDYVFDSRDFNTYYAQTVVDGIIQGDLFTLPGGDVSLLVGAQYRLDEINSQPDDIARDGLFFGFFADGGARGERKTKEVYGEVAIPLGLGKTFFRQFDLNLAGRLTDDEFYGTNETYSIKAGWRPIDSLFFKGTYGTSFRAPNLRELFLGGQTGFTNVADPCAVPTEAFDRLNGYNASNDNRSDTVLANCVAQGLDPTSFLGGQFTTYSVEVNTGGTTDLEPETSDSFTVGASFDQPFTDFFDLEIGATYYEIDIQDTVLSPSTAFILNDCYNQPNLTSAFCSRITRDPNDPANPGVISFLDAGFINRDQETARGIDFSADFEKRDISVFNRNFDFSATARVNRLLERKNVDLINDVRLEEEFKGEFGYSKWRGQATANISYDKFRFSWTTLFQSSVSLDEEDKNQPGFDNFLDGGNVVTCSGPSNGDVNCRPVADADAYQVHNASVSYREDDWSLIVGVNNVLDKSPALVDPYELITSISNVPLGNGYDLEGREYFIRVSKSFR